MNPKARKPRPRPCGARDAERDVHARREEPRYRKTAPVQPPEKASFPGTATSMNTTDAKRVLETALICSQQPLALREMRVLFNDELGPDTVKALLVDLQDDWA